MAKYNVHGGHNPAGKIACGATDFLDESKEDRKIVKALISILKRAEQRFIIVLWTMGKVRVMY